MAPPTTYIFCGGGTGGHLYPALAIAERLHELQGERGGGRFLFLCSQRAIDREILSAELVGGRPVEFRPLPAMPVSLKPLGLARFVGSWGPSVRQAREAIREAKRNGGEGTKAQRHRGTTGEAGGRRVVVVAMGGFVAAPGAQAARVEKVELVLVNLDAVPGKANRWIARRADRVLTAADVGPAPAEGIGGPGGAPGAGRGTRGGGVGAHRGDCAAAGAGAGDSRRVPGAARAGSGSAGAAGDGGEPGGPVAE